MNEICMICKTPLRKTTENDSCLKEGFIAICPKCNAEYDEVSLDQCDTLINDGGQ